MIWFCRLHGQLNPYLMHLGLFYVSTCVDTSLDFCGISTSYREKLPDDANKIPIFD